MARGRLFEDGKIKEREATAYDDDDIGEFEGLIQTYSGRSLTYDSDIYHAFAGLNNYFKKRLRGDLVHGMPNTYFDWFLLWNPISVQKRRDKVPSWSWSGWIGESWPHMWDWYNRSMLRVRGALRQRTWIIWYQRKAHNSEEVIRVWTPKKSSQPTSQPRNFYGGHTKDRFPIDCSRTTPTPRKLTGAPEYFEDSHNPTPGSGFLQCWTVSLVFKLGRPTSADENDEPTNGITRFGIYGRSNRELGIVYLHPEWAKANLGKDHEFIILCEGRDKRAEYDEIDEEEGWRYKVMLIVWKGDWAERISVGSIGKDDLNQSAYGPQWKEIILG
ncbi:hypothetical protein CPB84DRAFT_1789294 [Gymnopilus junonius]|uniref:Uncharacterized protein n=1 Tax=Gymnopilus junonius TaxID=109634 RepID=A0A9P5NDP2_GYMJU|nr:hypothetical protein CPB84DRAFT_1789294 [Gymnopilus junonius]